MIAVKRHAEEIHNEPWFHTRPWVIAGTGPSLNDFKPSDIENNFNILAIYNAADILTPDLYFCLDEGSWQYRSTSNYRYAVARLDSRVDYPENTLYVAVHNNPQYEGFEGYPSQCSSAQAVEYLSRAGLKKVYTIGIDGGIGVTANGIHDYYRETSKKLNFDDENKIMFDTAKRVGVELVKL